MQNESKSVKPVSSVAKKLPPALPYLPGLDGLRALSVAAVLLFHADARWLPGGFLGVEAFFVISGFLISTLLIGEWQATGRISQVRFWLRRARRLLPALWLLVATTLAFALTVLPEAVAELRTAALAGLSYTTNWYLIFDRQPYFAAAGRPGLLLHLWSLAVEAQFYILWPVALALLLRLGRKGALLGSLAGALASTLLMLLLFCQGVDTSRIYYGTDTRVAGMLIGAGLACAWHPRRRGRLLVDAFGLLGLIALGWLMLNLSPAHPLLYQGGFFAVAAATAAVVAAVAHPRTWLMPRLIGIPPLRWLGQRAYSIYLWHWPVFSLTRPGLDLPFDGPALAGLRLGLTLLLAELSYQLIERPIHGGAIERAWASLRGARGLRRVTLGLTWTLGISVCIGLGGGLAVLAAHEDDPAPAAFLPPTIIPTAYLALTTEPTPGLNDLIVAAARWRAPTPLPTLPPLPTATPTPTPPIPTQEPPTPEPAPPPPAPLQGPIVAIGDSVMLGAAAALNESIGALEVDAAVSRQIGAVTELVQARHTAGLLGDAVIIQTGNNDYLTPEQLDALLQELAGIRRVILVNVHVAREWEGYNNSVISDVAQHYPNVIVVDWNGASSGRWELFWTDGTHLRPEGARLYADLIAAALYRP